MSVTIIETNLSFGSMTNRSRTNRIILHHAEATSCTAEDIHRWHLGNGWSGAGYHFLVRKDGSVYRLRPENKVGAHASGSNSDSLGICFEGRYNSETMPQAQIDAGRALVAHLKGKYSITTVQAHRDVCSTDCPGANFPFAEIAGAPASSAPAQTGGQPAVTGASGSIADVQRWAGSAADGIFGPNTKAALVRKLQRELNAQFGRGLAVDGIWGPKTKAACVNVRRGAKGNITRTLQGALICLGYSTGGFDGIFGAATEQAVRSLQRARGLSVDGIAGCNTFAALLG